MNQPRETQRVKVIANSCNHSYRVGAIYVVRAVDPNDSTVRLADKAGRSRDWIAWSDIAPAVLIGWDFIKKHIAPETVDLLSCFDGLDGLQLSDECQARILLALPNLHEEILKAAAEADELQDVPDAAENPPRRKRFLP